MISTEIEKHEEEKQVKKCEYCCKKVEEVNILSTEVIHVNQFGLKVQNIKFKTFD